MAEQTAPNLGIKHGWNLAESGWHSGMENNLFRLDTITQLSVKDRDLSSPPASPAYGDRYIVGPAPTGIWAGKSTQIAIFLGAAWAFFTPKAGWIAYIEDEAKLSAFNGTSWTSGLSI